MNKPTLEIFNELVNKLKTTTGSHLSEAEMMQSVRPYLENVIKCSFSWLEADFYHVDSVAGFNGYKIYEEENHTLAIYVTSWLSGRGAPPHNHGTWSLVGGLVGEETNIFWKRIDDGAKEGYGEISEINKVICKAGDILMLDSNTIHSVINQTSQVSISLQIYGKHPHYTNRVQFNTDTNETKPFYGKEAD